jgi:AcrR family transcriptional regulator
MFSPPSVLRPAVTVLRPAVTGLRPAVTGLRSRRVVHLDEAEARDHRPAVTGLRSPATGHRPPVCGHRFRPPALHIISLCTAQPLMVLTDPPVINRPAPMARPSDPNAKIKLIAACEAVFVARGLEAAKVEEITQKAGLSKGSFYNHFESKDDAFRYLVEAMVARMAVYLEAIPADCPGEIGDIEGFCDHWVNNDLQVFEFIWQNRGLMSLLLEGGSCAAYRHLVDEFADRARMKMRAFLESAIRQGLYRADLDLDLTSSFIAGAYDRLARQIVRQRHRPDLRAMLRHVQWLVLRGVGSPAFLAQLEDARVSHPNRTPVKTKKKAKS